VKRVPRNLHRIECKLPHCPWAMKQVRSKMVVKSVQHDSPQVTGSAGMKADHSEKTSEGKKARSRKRKRHPDEPTADPNPLPKRQQVSYEDLYSDSPALPPPTAPARMRAEISSSTSQTTCFFWYHGPCARSRDRGGCPMRHALPNTPAMVEPPPGYVHKVPCGLEWCPDEAYSGEGRVVGTGYISLMSPCRAIDRGRTSRSLWS